jgi:hypothetical protein
MRQSKEVMHQIHEIYELLRLHSNSRQNKTASALFQFRTRPGFSFIASTGRSAQRDLKIKPHCE